MSVWGRTLTFFGLQGMQRREGIQSPIPMSYASPSAAAVTFDTAMSVSAFWASVRVISETIASMPIKAYKLDGDTRVVDTDYPLWRLLNYRPNRYQTRTEFFETIGLNLAATGNSYAAVERNAGGIPISILPLMSAQMTVELIDGEPVYCYNGEDGTTKVYAAESIWHIKLFGNGLIGLSPIGYMRNSLGIAIASDSRASVMAASGGKTNGVLMVDKLLNPDQRKAIRRNFAGLTEGSVDQLFVLEADMKFERTALSPQDMQLLETRKFQIEDIARFMGVPSVLINDTSGTTAWGSGIQQIIEGWYKLGLRPYLERIESSMKRHLMPSRDWETIEIEFDFDSLLRVSQNERFEGNNKAINSGQLTPNEARKEEGRPPLDGGDTIYLNSTLVPAGSRPDLMPPTAGDSDDEAQDITP